MNAFAPSGNGRVVVAGSAIPIFTSPGTAALASIPAQGNTFRDAHPNLLALSAPVAASADRVAPGLHPSETKGRRFAALGDPGARPAPGLERRALQRGTRSREPGLLRYVDHGGRAARAGHLPLPAAEPHSEGGTGLPPGCAQQARPQGGLRDQPLPAFEGSSGTSRPCPGASGSRRSSPTAGSASARAQEAGAPMPSATTPGRTRRPCTRTTSTSARTGAAPPSDDRLDRFSLLRSLRGHPPGPCTNRGWCQGPERPRGRVSSNLLVFMSRCRQGPPAGIGRVHGRGPASTPLRTARAGPTWCRRPCPVAVKTED